MLSRYLEMGGQQTRDPPVEEINQREEEGVCSNLTQPRRLGRWRGHSESATPLQIQVKTSGKRELQTQAS